MSVNSDFGLWLLAAFFIYAAYLNLNDPDPEVWVTAYMLAAAVMVWSTLSSPRLYWAVPHTLLLVAAVHARTCFSVVFYFFIVLSPLSSWPLSFLCSSFLTETSNHTLHRQNLFNDRVSRGGPLVLLL